MVPEKQSTNLVNLIPGVLNYRELKGLPIKMTECSSYKLVPSGLVMV